MIGVGIEYKDHHVYRPTVYYEIESQHIHRRLSNGVVNGQPFDYRRNKVITRIFATNFEFCLLPIFKLKKLPKQRTEATFELAYNPLKTPKLKGKVLMGESTSPIYEKHQATRTPDAFESTPKLHCGIDIDSRGYFQIYVGLDFLTVFNELRGEWFHEVQRSRRQCSQMALPREWICKRTEKTVDSCCKRKDRGLRKLH